MSRANPFTFRAVTAGLLLLAFLLRVWGLAFGLPYEFHPDEHQYVDTALTWHVQGRLELGFINPPLFTYLLSLVFWPWLAVSPFQPTPEWVSAAYVFARLWCVTFGMLTVALVFPLAKRIGGKNAGLVALALMAFLFLPARESHFAVNDTAVTFLVLLAIYFCLVLLNRPRLGTYLAIGVTIGLAAAAKLTGGLVIVVLLIAYFFTIKSETNRPLRQLISHRYTLYLLCALLAALVAFGLVSAHIFLNLPEFRATIVDHLRFGTEGYKGLQMAPVSGWIFYLNVLGWGVGWPMVAAMLGALLLVAWRRDPPALLLAAFPVALFLYMGGQKILFARFLLPAIPPLVVLVAVSLVRVVRAGGLLRRLRPALLLPPLVAILVAQPLVYLIWFDHLLTRPDTRELASAWFAAQVPPDTVLTKESYSILPATHLLNRHWPYKLIHLDERGATRDALDHYVTNKTELIATSSFTADRLRSDPAAEQARLDQLDYLAEQAVLIKTFSPFRQGAAPDWFYLDELYGPAAETLQRVRPGPLINLYRLPYQNQPHTFVIPKVAVPIEANFGDKLMLLGYDLPQRRAQPGESIPLTLYWQALSRMDKSYVIFNRLLDSEQRPWGGYDRWPRETANTILWTAGEIVTDTFSLPVAGDAPAGIYTIDLGLYDQADQSASPLPILRDGRPVGQTSIRIGPVKIGNPSLALAVAAATVEPEHVVDDVLGEPPTIRLRGYDLNRVESGLALTLYWESLSPTPVDWSIFVHVRNPAGAIVAQKDGPAGGGPTVYPTSLWDAGEIVVDEIAVPLPADPPVDEYTLVVGLYNLADFSRLSVPDSPANEIILTNR